MLPVTLFPWNGLEQNRMNHKLSVLLRKQFRDSFNFWKVLSTRGTYLFILAGLLLTACGAPAAPTPTATLPPTTAPTRELPPPEPTPTLEPAQPTPSSTPPLPTAVPIAEVTGEDWIRGPEDASITLLVYSDFQ
jgi:hypothetical protein